MHFKDFTCLTGRAQRLQELQRLVRIQTAHAHDPVANGERPGFGAGNDGKSVIHIERAHPGGTVVAVKLIQSQKQQDAVQRELAISSLLIHHASIVRLYGACRTDDKLVIVM
ncbi:MAG: protein kinase, partial [Inhella sp.]